MIDHQDQEHSAIILQQIEVGETKTLVLQILLDMTEKKQMTEGLYHPV